MKSQKKIALKCFLFILMLICFHFGAKAQNVIPNTFHYQSVVRNSSGSIAANQTVNFRFSVLLDNNAATNPIYTEVKQATTNNLGVVNTTIGDPNSATYNNIDWRQGYRFIKVEIDPAGGTNFTNMGLVELQGSAYANIAKKLLQNPAMQELSNVNTTGLAIGNVLKWNGSEWAAASDNTGGGGTLTYNAGTGININGSVITNTGDLSATNELQHLTISGNTLTLDQNGGTVTLPNTDNQTLAVSGNQLSISGGNAITLPSGGTAYSGGTGINVNGSLITNTGDLSATNELQHLTISGNTLTLDQNGGTVTLPNTNTDNQTLAVSGNQLSISGGNAITLPNTDNQTLAVSGNQLSISGGNAITLPSGGTAYSGGTGINVNGSLITNTGDLSATNELQHLTISGNTLTLDQNGGTITLPNTNTDNQTLALSGNQLSISGGNAITLPSGGTAYSGGTGINVNGSLITNTGDLSATNELQHLTISGNTLTLDQNGGTVTLPNTNTDNQTLAVSGNQLSISGGNAIALPNTNTDNQTLALNGNQLSISGGNAITLPSGGGSTNYVGGSDISITSGLAGDFFINNTAPSKWTANGPDIFNNTAGKVMIGTNSIFSNARLVVQAPINGTGIQATGQTTGVLGTSTNGTGIEGSSQNANGVVGTSTHGTGGFFSSQNQYALITNQGKVGIGTLTPQFDVDIHKQTRVTEDFYCLGEMHTASVYPTQTGAFSLGDQNQRWSQVYCNEVRAAASGGQTAIIGFHTDPGGYAGEFFGDVVINNSLEVVDNLNVSGSVNANVKNFKIDHPLDPANKFLYHSCIESPDMMNIYNGNTATDEKGFATVTLPAYFEAENMDFKYQLTCMGQFAQAIVKEKVANNKFVIQTDKPNVEVSWQVTGIRQDAYAKAHRVVPEVDKKGAEKGKYLNPELFNAGPEAKIGGSSATKYTSTTVTPK